MDIRALEAWWLQIYLNIYDNRQKEIVAIVIKEYFVKLMAKNSAEIITSIFLVDVFVSFVDTDSVFW